ncbi:MAG: hypothetical protein U1E65_32240 [Myxococcota bacterium]
MAEKKFDAVLMNPPFGSGSIRGQKDFEKAGTPIRTKNDVYAAFVEREQSSFSHLAGASARYHLRTGFFLTSFQKWREDVLLAHAPPVLFAWFGARRARRSDG